MSTDSLLTESQQKMIALMQQVVGRDLTYDEALDEYCRAIARVAFVFIKNAPPGGKDLVFFRIMALLEEEKLRL